MLFERFNRARTYVTSPGLGPFIIRSVAGSGAVQLAGMALTFLMGVQLARGLGVSGYGYYGIAMAVITLATVPGSLGIPQLVTREVAAARSRGDLAALFGILRWADRTCWRMSAAIAVLVGGGALFAWRTGSSTVAEAILFGAPMILLVPLGTIRGGALRGLHHVVLGQVGNTLFRPLAMSVLLFGYALAGARFGAPAAMMLNTISAVGALFLTARWLATRLPEQRPATVAVAGRGWLASSIPMALTQAVQILQLQLSVLVLGMFTTPAQVGLFRVSTSTAAVIAVPVTVVNLVVLPMFARLHAEGDRCRLQKLVTSSARLQLAGVFVLSLPLLILPGALFSLVFGKSYAAAAATIRILAVGAIFSSAFGPNAALLNMTGHERRVTRAVTIALLVNLVVIALLASKLGSAGTAFGVLAGQLCWNLLLWLDARRDLAIDTSAVALAPEGPARS